jgi:C_GCAxxG_C_C family probable redox protein
MSDRTERAVEIFSNGYSCSQAVLAAFSIDFGLDEDTALRISGGFGGGFGRLGETCGALSGAIMVIGLAFRGAEAGRCEAKDITYAKVRETVERFREANGATECRELLGIDILSDEGDLKAREAGLYRTICPKLVESAANILEDLL